MNNNEADINTECGISANINYNFFTQGEDSVKVISVPNQSYNTIGEFNPVQIYNL